MTETIREMEDRWSRLVSAKDKHTGRRLTETDPKYLRQCHALRVEIEDRKKTEASQPQINEQQLAWLSRAQAATDKDGRRLYQPGSQYQKNVDAVRAKVFEGDDISGNIAATEKDIADKGGTLPPALPTPTLKQRQAGHEVGLNFGPPSHATQLGGGSAEATPLITMGT